MDQDQPRHVVSSPVPTFTPPRTATLDPDLPEVEAPTPYDPTAPDSPDNPTPNARRPAGLFGRPVSLRLATPGSDTPTATSTTSGDRPPLSKEDVKLTGELVAVVIGAVFIGAAALVRLRRGRKLRQPTKRHLADMGAPVGRIAARHLNPAWLNADLVDAIEAGSVVAAWAAEGPLTVPDKPDPNIPPVNQEES